MSIHNFDDLLGQSQLQSQPQRLLLVFANAELPDDATDTQRRGFSKGEGGALVPHMCVDKLPQEIATFQHLLEESAEHAPDWRMVFVAALAGSNGVAPTSNAADPHLQRMVEMIRAGMLASLLAFDRQGLAVQLG
jgi:hypothetical protein